MSRGRAANTACCPGRAPLHAIESFTSHLTFLLPDISNHELNQKAFAKAVILAVSWTVQLITLQAEESPASWSALIDASPRIVVERNPGDSSIVAVYVEREPNWWGRLHVFRRKGDAIVRGYTWPGEYEPQRGHYVHRFRWVSLRQISKPVLEVIDSTHMGNGSLRLFEVGDSSLRLLVDLPARGRCWAPPAALKLSDARLAQFAGEALSVEYVDSEATKSTSIRLTGSLNITDALERPIPSASYEQIVDWDEKQRQFQPRPPTSPPSDDR